MLLHVVAMHLPLGQRVLGTSVVPLFDWAILLGLALSIFVVMELHKLVRSLIAGAARRGGR